MRKEQPLARIAEVTDGTFESDVLKSSIPVLVLFWSPIDESRERVEAAMEDIANRFQDRVRIAILNAQEYQHVRTALRITQFPTLALFKGDRVVEICPCTLAGPQVERLIEQSLVLAA